MNNLKKILLVVLAFAITSLTVNCQFLEKALKRMNSLGGFSSEELGIARAGVSTGLSISDRRNMIQQNRDIPVSSDSEVVLSDFLDVNSFGEIDFSVYDQDQLREIVGRLLRDSIALEEAKLSDTDSWYVNTEDADSNEYIELSSMDRKISIFTLGDLHGNLAALINIIRDFILRGVLTTGLKISEDYKGCKFICLGDIVDRGQYSLEVVSLLMILRLLNPDNFIILKGNHENLDQFLRYGFSDELKRKLGEDSFVLSEGKYLENKSALIFKFVDYFKLLPSAFFVRKPFGKLTQFNHAGWSNLENERDFLSSNKRFFRISDLRSEEFVWSDISLSGSDDIPSTRGAGRDVGIFRVVEEMEQFNVLIKISGHQHHLPKTRIENEFPEQIIESGDLSYGFIKLLENQNIFVLMSGSIKYGDMGINYYPSYLELTEEGVYGYTQFEDGSPFVRITPNEMPIILNQEECSLNKEEHSWCVIS